MRSINTLSFAPDANDWLANSRHPRILHVFDRACNLINERREVLSVVTPQIGNGPFNLVIDGDVMFSDTLSIQSPISKSPHQLTLGSITLHTADAKLWHPRPNWEMLHTRKNDILNQLAKLQITNHLFPNSPISNSLVSALSTANLSSARTAAQQLAGLGSGLTPAGDDFILGAVLAVWIIHPPVLARCLAEEITKNAAPLTTSLSGAWLRSAGKGEAGILWHIFFDALISADMTRIQDAMDKILAVGATSGTDALTGFINTFISYAETGTKLCHS